MGDSCKNQRPDGKTCSEFAKNSPLRGANVDKKLKKYFSETTGFLKYYFIKNSEEEKN